MHVPVLSAVSRGLERPVLYPRVYPWLILMAALDVMVTWIVLAAGGMELNALAARVIDAAGLPGMIAYKFSCIGLVLILCEAVGRHRARAGSGLARWAVAMNALPVGAGIAQLYAIS